MIMTNDFNVYVLKLEVALFILILISRDTETLTQVCTTQDEEIC